MDGNTFRSSFESEIEKIAVRYAEMLRAGKLSPESKGRLGLSGPTPSLHAARQGTPAQEELGKLMGRKGLGPLGSNTFQTTPGIKVSTEPGRMLAAQKVRKQRAASGEESTMLRRTLRQRMSPQRMG